MRHLMHPYAPLLSANITFHSKLPYWSTVVVHTNQYSWWGACLGLELEMAASIIQVPHTEIKLTKEHDSSQKPESKQMILRWACPFTVWPRRSSGFTQRLDEDNPLYTWPELSSLRPRPEREAKRGLWSDRCNPAWVGAETGSDDFCA